VSDQTMQDTAKTHPDGDDAIVELLGGPNEMMIFFRLEGFYPIQGIRGIPLAQQAAENAELNPGTLRVEDMHGNVLWRSQ
jgi:hypothetical protein